MSPGPEESPYPAEVELTTNVPMHVSRLKVTQHPGAQHFQEIGKTVMCERISNSNCIFSEIQYKLGMMSTYETLTLNENVKVYEKYLGEIETEIIDDIKIKLKKSGELNS